MKPSGIYTAPDGRNQYYNCKAGVHVWRDRALFQFHILECAICGALDGCGIGARLMTDLLFLEAKKREANAK